MNCLWSDEAENYLAGKIESIENTMVDFLIWAFNSLIWYWTNYTLLCLFLTILTAFSVWAYWGRSIRRKLIQRSWRKKCHTNINS